jgi:ABC-type dipeptide/oligopeptide/nickel transport system permease component
MMRFVIRRFLMALLIVWAVVTIVFFSMRIIPADPAEVALGDYASAEALAAFRKDAGLDQPLLGQYLDLLTGLAHGDLGRSIITQQSISEQITAALPHTLALALGALLVGVIIGIPLGVATAVKRGTWIDFSGRFISLLGLSFPSFYVGIVLLIVFSVWLGWFPIIHAPRSGTIGETLYKLVLPSLSLGFIQSAYIARLTRSTMLETLSQDYIRTAFAKGLHPMKVYFKHALRNVMIPVVTAIGLYTGAILGGAILTETVFSRPGLGKLLLGAVAQRDYNLVQSGLIVFSSIVILVNLLVDLSYSLLDPQVKNA